MAFSYNERAAADSSDKTYAFTFPYLDSDHILCMVDGVDLTPDDETNGFVAGVSDVTIGSAVGITAGNIVRVYRVTPSTILVDFQANQTVLETHLDTVALQTLYRALEAYDRSVDVLPTGGAAGAVLRKTTATDFDVQWDTMLDPTLPGGDMDGGAITWDSAGLPVGVVPTADGQVLTATDGNTDQANWEGCPRVLRGTGAPAGSTGYDDDWYIDMNNKRMYEKTSGVWTQFAILSL